jgi:hypothetical protein
VSCEGYEDRRQVPASALAEHRKSFDEHGGTRSAVLVHPRPPCNTTLRRRPRQPQGNKHAIEGALPTARICRQPKARYGSRTSWLGLMLPIGLERP